MNSSHFLSHSLFFALAFGLAAASGAYLRHICNTALKKWTGNFFPWGIFCVNILGCFGFGCVLALGEHTPWLEENFKTILLTAFFGSFTTFSSYIFDGHIFLKNKEYLKLSFYVGAQIVLGLGFFWAGMHFY